MNSSRNSSRGRQGKKKPSSASSKKFDTKRKFSDSSKSKTFKSASESEDSKRPQRFETSKYKSDRKSSISSKENSSPKKTASNPETDGIRLNKYIANAGICSRREADVYIAAGNATVNGKVVTEMGYKVQLTDEVRFDGSSINPEAKRYVLLNKPKNFITTMDDDRGRKTVMELVANASKERIYPVGRLDRNTTGLLLFTNDGEMAKKLTHPKHHIQKLYHASLDKKLSMSDLTKISEGFMLDDKRVIVDEISYIMDQPKSEVGIKIHSGRNRIVRRIFEHFNYSVVKLDRVVFAGLTKKDLPRGHWRHLTEMEVNNLKML
ncbi:rRNA pseudouridine synthase [Lutibacter sp. HS1-25]|uniref:pseudouridine synthase n=1 Tax=Lutibacter sp. HS1-25 TaxID=2485000 RepID=UPI0010122D41|nr:pseudouridine synthase [Lutibacter sp. HS1-25]RXP45199.1 rRNA pseudouridine synthase [Lutibacter sp. HS1-25]